MKINNNFKILVFIILAFYFENEQSYSQENGKTNDIVYSNLNSNDFSIAKNNLLSTLTLNKDLLQIIVGNDSYNSVSNLGIPSEIRIDDQKVEFVYKDKKNNPINTVAIHFTYLLDLKLKSYKLDNRQPNGTVYVENHLKVGNVTLMMNWQYNVIISSILRNLKQIQDSLNNQRFNMAQFKKYVVENKSAKNNPISEEQRKNIIKANTYTKLYEYQNAIEAYKKVLEINQVNYAAAYFNLALLSAELNKLYTAIDYMEKYIVLNESSDTSVAKSKIDEWNFILNN